MSEGWSTIYKERHRETGEVERVWYAIGPQRSSQQGARADMPMAVRCYTIEGITTAGRHDLLYAGPSSEMAEERMQSAAASGRFERFDSKWWDSGDVDGVDFSGDGSPTP